MRKISPQSGFDNQNDHPVASRYTDWAIVDHNKVKEFIYVYILCFNIVKRKERL